MPNLLIDIDIEIVLHIVILVIIFFYNSASNIFFCVEGSSETLSTTLKRWGQG